MIFTPIPHISKGGQIFDDYIAPKESLYIKGIFVILVLLSHFSGYIVLSDSLADYSFNIIRGYLGQFIVTMFFFYSGYGIFESVKRKGKLYIQSFPKKRLFFVWLSFAVCVNFFLIGGWLLGNTFSSKQIVLSYIAWDNLGNSNWFMFVTFGIYVIFFCVYIFAKDTQSLKGLLSFTILIGLFSVVLFLVKEKYWWWDTAICFPLGMWFSRYKMQIEEYIKQKKFMGIVLFVAVVIGFLLLFYVTIKYTHIFYPISACLFCLIIVMLTMKIKIRNPILAFFGKHVFSIYMLQRLWYIPLSKLNMNCYLFFLISISLTIISAMLFDCLMKKIKF